MYIYIYTHIYIHTYINIYIYMYIYIYIYKIANHLDARGLFVFVGGMLSFPLERAVQLLVFLQVLPIPAPAVP